MQGKSQSGPLRRFAVVAVLALLSRGGAVVARTAPDPGRPAAAGSALPGVFEIDAGALKSGAWVRYLLVNRTTNKAATIRIAVLEREAGGRWFEVTISDERNQRIVYRTLVKGAATKSAEVLRAIVQPPAQRPLLLPDKLAGQQLPPMTTGRYREAQLVGKVSVKTPAGTFRTKHLRRRDKDGAVEHAWLSTKLAGWPLVRFRSRRIDIEINGHGTDAQSQIRGRPVKLDPRLLKGLGGP